ncbi:MAG TPA: metal-dependent hydrolase [Candidatus Acidoferrales bacterium]|nr:metal-dependent hydrolase [Candidatus Acidoferrales bacterium]
MEPFTHAFASLAIARVFRQRLPRFGTTLLVIAGVAPDLDYASYFAGPSAFLALHRSALHSIAGAAVLSCALAALFPFVGAKSSGPQNPRKQLPPPTFSIAFALCAVGVIAHDLLDLCSGEGIQWLWPFRTHWSHWNLAESFDPWALLILVAGLLIPQLFRLVSEEVGARKKNGSGAAVFTLLLLLAYFGARAYFQKRVTDLLLSAEFHGREPLSAGAFPSSTNPLSWRGVVSTDNTLEEIGVSLAPGADFNPDRSLTHYKPPDSPPLDTAEKSHTAQRFLRYAEFPLASVFRREDGYRVELRDLRFPEGDQSPANLIVRIELDASFHIVRQQLRYASAVGSN